MVLALGATTTCRQCFMYNIYSQIKEKLVRYEIIQLRGGTRVANLENERNNQQLNFTTRGCSVSA
ncbi:unnamed protein product [Amoebophrya sp. A120]|nr:unnamed protein product [Amoebophrya sp. A120]|eukprot:GSA120T00013110001.1